MRKLFFLLNKKIIFKIICWLNDYEYRYLCVDYGVLYLI